MLTRPYSSTHTARGPPFVVGQPGSQKRGSLASNPASLAAETSLDGPASEALIGLECVLLQPSVKLERTSVWKSLLRMNPPWRSGGLRGMRRYALRPCKNPQACAEEVRPLAAVGAERDMSVDVSCLLIVQCGKSAWHVAGNYRGMKNSLVSLTGLNMKRALCALITLVGLSLLTVPTLAQRHRGRGRGRGPSVQVEVRRPRRARRTVVVAPAPVVVVEPRRRARRRARVVVVAPRPPVVHVAPPPPVVVVAPPPPVVVLPRPPSVEIRVSHK